MSGLIGNRTLRVLSLSNNQILSDGIVAIAMKSTKVQTLGVHLLHTTLRPLLLHYSDCIQAMPQRDVGGGSRMRMLKELRR